MKLAILAEAYLLDPTSRTNGTLVQLYNLTNGLKRHNVEVHYICQTRDSNKPENETIDGIRFHWIQKENGILSWKGDINKYENIVERCQPDALYVRGRNFMQYVAGKYVVKHNGIYVWGTNGDDSAEFWKNTKRLHDSNKSFWRKLLLYPLKIYEDIYINNGMKMANYIVNQNQFQKEQTFKLLNREGIILNSYYHIHSTNDMVNKNQVFWMARWSKEKQPELFLDMISRLSNHQVDFVMAGDNSQDNHKELINRAGELGVKTIGKVQYEGIGACFAKSLIFVNTSYREGVSNTFIEALLHGLPVLSLNSNPNNWLTDYNIGYCADGDLIKLTNYLDELLKDREKLKKMSKEAVSFAKTHFSDDNIIHSYLKLFKGNA